MTYQIQLRRKLAATPDEVYAAWTDAASLAQWMVPIVGGRTEVQAEARVGGALHIDMYGLGSRYSQPAEYLRLERPHLVEFSWVADPAAAHRSIVTVELKPAGTHCTELTLTHRLLPDDASAQSHQRGWDAGLDSLAARFNHHFRREVHFKAPASALYAALATQQGLRGWWAQSCTADNAVGGEARFEFGESYKRMRIDTLRPDLQVRWQCLESRIRAEGRRLPDNEWAGTTLVFRINGDTPEHSVLRFEHLGLTPELACYDLCEGDWTRSLASLVSYVEIGTGTPHRSTDAGCRSAGQTA